jgi:hypothetical protein
MTFKKHDLAWMYSLEMWPSSLPISVETHRETHKKALKLA